jgi:class 3 adenylate cyclase/predicted ATPase
MLCPACHSECRSGAKYCKVCGTPLTVSCPACGARHEEGQRFCEECGAALTADVPVARNAPAPPSDAFAIRADAHSQASSPERRVVSVAFVDVVGFTSLSESRDPEDVREVLSQYFEIARTIVHRHGGVVEKFIGDAVVAVWGVPTAREDDAERAVRAALAVVNAVAVLGDEVGLPGLRARGGLVTGQVAAIAEPDGGLVVGDRVNTASRVQSAAEPGSVLVDEVTQQLTAAAVAFEDAGEHRVKGKVNALHLWRAVRVIAGIGGSDREQGLDAPLVGRDGDLWLLKELFHGALDRRSSRLVAVSGDAGVGKSRLRREFFIYVDGLSTEVLWHMGRCMSFGDGVAYWALAEMVRQRLGVSDDASNEETIERLESGLERWFAESAERDFLRPRVGALLGVTESDLERQELFAGWRLFFERLAARLPVVLVFEDLQWADAGLLDFIEELLDWSASSPIFILTLARPELVARSDSWPMARRGVTRLQLAPLDDDAMRTLLASLVAGLPSSAVLRIVARAQGIPLYGIEIVRSLTDRGTLSERDGHLELEGEVDELDVPPTVSALLTARLDALEPIERGFVKAMSVFGSSFTRAAATSLGGVEEAQLDAVLASLMRRQVLVIRADRLSPDRGHYAFGQELLRTAAYELLSRRERKSRHLAAAEHLRTTFPNDGEEVAELIAAHCVDAWRAAGQDTDAGDLRLQALAWSRRSAKRAATIGAPEVAERAYLLAADLSTSERDRTELTRAAGEMAMRSGRYSTALELLETAAEAHIAADRHVEAARIAYDIGLALRHLGRLREAVARLVAALEILPQYELDVDVARLNARLANSLAFLGEYERALPPVEKALAMAEALDLPAVLSDALTQKAIIYMWTGRPQQARYLFAAAVEIAQQHDLTRQLTIAQTNRGNLAALWDASDAEAQTDAGLVLARRGGDRSIESLNACNLMMIWLLTGRWDRVERLGQELLEDNDKRPGAEAVHFPLGILEALRGDHAAARSRLDRMAAWEHTEDADRRAIHEAVAVTAALAAGRFDDALELGQRMLIDAIDTLGAAQESVRQAWPDTLHAALALDRCEEALALVGMLADRPPGNVPPYLRAHLLRARALTNGALGHNEAVEADLSAAIDSFGRIGAPYWVAVSQIDLGTWLAGQGRLRDPATFLGAARDTLQRLGAAPALARAAQLE